LYEEEKRRTNALLFRFFSKLLEAESGEMCEPLHTRVKIDACESGGMGYAVPAKTMF
jgi:hypothetical protein